MDEFCDEFFKCTVESFRHVKNKFEQFYRYFQNVLISTGDSNISPIRS